MKLLIVLALLATSLLPVMPASAFEACSMSSSSPNEGSTLSSTSEGGIQSCPV